MQFSSLFSLMKSREGPRAVTGIPSNTFWLHYNSDHWQVYRGHFKATLPYIIFEYKYYINIYRPSRCPKCYTNRILGEQNLRQQVRKFCQNLNWDKMPFFNQIYFNSTLFNIGLYKTAT